MVEVQALPWLHMATPAHWHASSLHRARSRFEHCQVTASPQAFKQVLGAGYVLRMLERHSSDFFFFDGEGTGTNHTQLFSGLTPAYVLKDQFCWDLEDHLLCRGPNPGLSTYGATCLTPCPISLPPSGFYFILFLFGEGVVPNSAQCLRMALHSGSTPGRCSEDHMWCELQVGSIQGGQGGPTHCENSWASFRFIFHEKSDVTECQQDPTE